MLFYAGLLFLVIAVSLDGFTVGLAYGIQQIKIPRSSLLMIMILSGSIVLSAMLLGAFINPFISVRKAEQIGSLILIMLGIFALFNVYRGKYNKENSSNQSIPNMQSILVKPEQVDLDRSGIISFKESLLLGVALSLDAFGAGFAAALLNYSLFVTTVLIALSSGLFLTIGLNIGKLLARQGFIHKLSFVPGLILITLGLITLCN